MPKTTSPLSSSYYDKLVGSLRAICVLTLAAVSVTGVRAQVIFTDSMNYADNAAIQAAWAGGAGTLGSNPGVATVTNPDPTPVLDAFNPSPASGSFMTLGNGVRFRELGTTVTDSWTLDVKLLASSYSRSLGVFILNAAGTEGYGLLWNNANPNNNSGNGLVQIREFNNSSYTDYNSFGTGAQIGVSSNSGHAALGYAVTGVDGTTPANQNLATYDTSVWQDFLDLSLAWDSGTGQLTLTGGTAPVVITDTSFSSFSRIYVRGGTTGYFDELSVTVVPEPTVAVLFGAGLSFIAVSRRRRNRGATASVL